MGPLAFVALIPFLWVLRGSRPWRSLLLGFAFGFAYFASILYWVRLFGELGWGALSLASAAYPALFALLAPRVWREEHPVRSSFGLAALWTGTEYLRSLWPLGGFTWGGLGYSQTGNGFLLPLASVTGVWGITFGVALVNALLLVSIERSARRGLAALGMAGVSLAAVLAPGLLRIPEPDGRPLDVAVIQGNDIEGGLADRAAEIGTIVGNHAELQRTLALNPPDLSVWPEDAVDSGDLDPASALQVKSFVSQTIGEVGVPTLVGGVTAAPDDALYNRDLLYDGEGDVIDQYTKVHLVPFGEYIPWRGALDWISALRQIPRDLTPGSRPTLLHVDGVPFANVICFENSFPSLDRRLVDRGAGFIVVSTNNASYGRSAASRQHLAMSQLRAVENGRWVVHAAVSGISAFIDPHGRVYDQTRLFDRVVSRHRIETSGALTIYTRWGDYFPWASLFVAGGLVALPRRRKIRREAEPLAGEPRTLVILPTYNERDTIETVITGILEAAPAVDVLVVDDASPDGTGGIVRPIAERDSRVRLIERPVKGGLASAYATGFRRALEEGYDLVVEMDADLSHQPPELPRLLEGAARYDLTVGSRYVPGGGVTNWGLVRRLLSRAGNSYARAMLGIPVSDSTSGYRVFRRGLLRFLLDRAMQSEGYGFQIELVCRAWQAGFAVGEVPITFREREHGQSKISRRIVYEALWLVTVWGIRDRLQLRRKKTSDRSHDERSSHGVPAIRR